MNAQQATGFAIRKAHNPAEVLQRSLQIRCHLLCAGRQISRFRFERIPFHVLGILRAIGV